MTYALHTYRPKFGLSQWREIAGFSIWTWITVLVSLIWERSDPFILGRSFGVAGLGLYLIALELGTLPVTELISPTADALFAGFAQARRDGASALRSAPLIASSMFLCVLPIVAAISATSGYIVAVLLGAKWSNAQPLLAILVWACSFSPFSFVATTVLVANGFLKRNLLANFSASCLKLLVLVIAVSSTTNMSVIAAAVAACVAVESGVYIFLLRGTGGVDFREGVAGAARGTLACAIASGVIFLSGFGWRINVPTGWLALAPGVVIGLAMTAVYATIELALWAVSGAPSGPEEMVIAILRNAVKTQLQWLAGKLRPHSKER